LAKSPFSLAIIRGAESVRAINPSFAVVTSGVSVAATGLAAGEASVEEEELVVLDVQALIKNVAAVAAPAVTINLRRETLDIVTLSKSFAVEC
jgi:hypothetical protein